MSKKPFVSKEKLDEIAAQYATPFYLYDETAIRETARRVNKAFAWNQGFKEYFAVKASPKSGVPADWTRERIVLRIRNCRWPMPLVLKAMKLCFRPMQRRQKIFSWQGN